MKKFSGLFVIVVTACGAGPVEWLPTRVPPFTVTKPVVVDTCGWAINQATDKDLLDEAIAETQTTVNSDLFRERLAAVALVYPGTCADDRHSLPPQKQRCVPISGASLLVLYESAEVPVTYEPSTKTGETADTDIAPASDSISGAAPLAALTNMNPNNLDRWKPGTGPGAIESRACLINTIAHEWTHAIPDSRGHVLFTDNGHNHFWFPLVSYTVGAVAQCSYLQRNCAIQPDQFEDCVRRVGTQRFYGDVCNAGWTKGLRAERAARTDAL